MCRKKKINANFVHVNNINYNNYEKVLSNGYIVGSDIDY